jgi:hypothetical protein
MSSMQIAIVVVVVVIVLFLAVGAVFVSAAGPTCPLWPGVRPGRVRAGQPRRR